jgi:hypothetical protein
MKKLTAVLILAALAAACDRESDQTNRKVDALLARIDALEKKVDAKGQGMGAAAGRPGMPGQPGQPGQMPQRPPEPDPKLTYSVDLTGSPSYGPDNAKVTIVEAFDFA